MRVIGLGSALLMTLPWWAHGRSQQVTVPFVGCPADIQGEHVDAPQGTPVVVPLDAETAQGIAYYEGGNTPGVFAPRGWHCWAWGGSSGATLLVVPTASDSPSVQRRKIRHGAVELEFLDGGTSGRFGVARYASRLFPRVAASYIDRVKSESVTPPRDFALGPYVNESVRYPDSLTAEFTTPPGRTGLGTEYELAPSQDTIHGVVVLSPSAEWGMWILRVRLRPTLRHLEAPILKLNAACLWRGPC